MRDPIVWRQLLFTTCDWCGIGHKVLLTSTHQFALTS